MQENLPKNKQLPTLGTFLKELDIDAPTEAVGHFFGVEQFPFSQLLDMKGKNDKVESVEDPGGLDNSNFPQEF